MIIFDASTLILLPKADLLPQVLEEFPSAMPESVRVEVTRKETMDAAVIQELISRVRLAVRPDPAAAQVRRLVADFRIGRGEAAAFLLAQRVGATLATDDGVAIRICKSMGVPFATAIHFLIAAKASGRLGEDLALAKLDLLAHWGRYAARIVEDAARRVRGGEEQWE